MLKTQKHIYRFLNSYFKVIMKSIDDLNNYINDLKLDNP